MRGSEFQYHCIARANHAGGKLQLQEALAMDDGLMGSCSSVHLLVACLNKSREDKAEERLSLRTSAR